MKHLLCCLLSLLLVSTCHASAGKDAITFLATGDWPYRRSQLGEVHQLVEQINTTNADFVVHVGDIAHPGDKASDKLTCSDATFDLVADIFEKIKLPLIYTPGDNEWTDCARDADDPHSPLERLSVLRKQFFSAVESTPFTMVAQQQPFVENRRWVLPLEASSVVFTTLHMVGSHNNLTYTRAADLTEFTQREKANQAWLQGVFETANTQNASAVVVFFHADPHIEGTFDQQLGFRQIITSLVNHASGFGKPVLLVHGDSHHFRVDTPFTYKTKPWPIAPNIIRLISNGDPVISATPVTIRLNQHGQAQFTIGSLSPTTPLAIQLP